MVRLITNGDWFLAAWDGVGSLEASWTLGLEAKKGSAKKLEEELELEEEAEEFGFCSG